MISNQQVQVDDSTEDHLINSMKKLYIQQKCLGPTAARLQLERKRWRQAHPFGFYAKPIANEDATKNIIIWRCGIPGRPKSLYEGIVITVILEFPMDYPQFPPLCSLQKPIFLHPNVFRSGRICFGKINEDWNPKYTISDILFGIQSLIHSPNIDNPACAEAYCLYMYEPEQYKLKVKKQLDEIRELQKDE